MGKKLMQESLAKRGINFKVIAKKKKIKDLQELDKKYKKILRS